jgi:hypothetical protein
MCTDERKAVLMLIDRVNRDLPAVYPMAKIALGSVSAAMNIDVAVLTLLAGVRQNRIHMAALARRVHVHAA